MSSPATPVPGSGLTSAGMSAPAGAPPRPSATVGAPAGGAPGQGPANHRSDGPRPPAGHALPQHVGGQPGQQAGTQGTRRTTRRPPRLASLQLKRVDPWTVLKISLIVSIVMFFVWMIAIGILYLSLGSMDVWTKVNETFSTLTTSDSSTTGGSALITPLRVFLVTGVIGAINIVLFTALATVAAFVYNAAAAMSGGVELTLGERD